MSIAENLVFVKVYKRHLSLPNLLGSLTPAHFSVKCLNILLWSHSIYSSEWRKVVSFRRILLVLKSKWVWPGNATITHYRHGNPWNREEEIHNTYSLLIVLIPDLCLPFYFNQEENLSEATMELSLPQRDDCTKLIVVWIVLYPHLAHRAQKFQRSTDFADNYFPCKIFE